MELIAFNLEAEGYAVITATSSLEALNRARAILPDLIVLDLMLPELDGFSVCEILRRLPSTAPIPIIMLAEQIRDVPLGAVVAVLADDPAAYTDIPSWCAMKAHEFAGHQELPQGGWALYIRRML